MTDIASLASRTFSVRDIEVSHRPIVGWALNDRLVPARLTEQMQAFQRCGYGGMMLVPWRGLPYQVMDDEWLERIGHILAVARDLGLEVWIWDDWVFPSGPAGGVVTAESDDYKSKVLRIAVDLVLEPGESLELRVPERALAAAVFPVDKFNNPCGPFMPLPAEDGATIHHTATVRERLMIVRWQLTSAMQHTPKSQLEGADIFSDDDRSVFSLDMLNPAATRRMLEVLHERYWERFPEYFGGTLKGFFYDEPGLPNLFPWTHGFAEEFRRRKGYDLAEHLIPMLVEYKMYDITFDLQSEEIKQVRADYMDVWTSRSAKAYYGQIQQWCREHGVVCTGHGSNDSGLELALAPGGHFYKSMYFNDLPGVDIVFNQLELGRFYDAPRLSGSRAQALGKAGAISESFAATGHGMDLDTMRFTTDHQIIRGVTKFLTKIANYNPELGFYFHPPELSEANLMMKHYGHHLTDRLANLCALMTGGEAPAQVALCIPLENFYRGDTGITRPLDVLARRLTYNQREFGYLWDQDLQEMTVADGFLVSSGGQRYSHLVIPPGARFTAEVSAHLASLAEQGCSIFRWDDNLVVEDLLADTRDAARPFSFRERNVPVSLARRILSPQRQLVFLLNESLEPQTLTLACASPWQPYEVQPEALTLSASGSLLRLAPGESRLLLLAIGSVAAENAVNLCEADAIHLDAWELAMPDGAVQRVEMPLPSWNDLGYPEYHGTMRYRTTFTWTAGASEAILQLGDLHYAATVFLDGQPAGNCVFTPFTLSLHGLQPGEHRLEVEVLNTRANLVCGTKEQTRRLEESGVFTGTYSPLVMPRDQQQILSGLLGPVKLVPVK